MKLRHLIPTILHYWRLWRCRCTICGGKSATWHEREYGRVCENCWRG